ncbi:tRNA 2-thiouridine(34) synthase MnmA [Candidatus Falkowbacteria bacterium CG_4_9_14_3_um_filter_36_9]|uniref:tRNA-specific 2-thiouridylase MnmA n=2 Tax=Candidatus Falkowiibacteriota TaxID=1752728 RepID=A0A1J4TAD5_9BACT|nr:MAG: tRNA 2-thiouridine(34) synthase MnmA [Candidatus Falkowbacteria bacterium CG1_02_37_44]PIV50548.1 MAG: tRNA 2-thiouridine(34) synthase MnmA [Candidatus Falkowbacteria bacterium CG02_land_8_20_14_3_00_36_14]PIX12355.1 MAG: tRNA 2-thiouridine(34) synthase MnmA [Candidatus Falkowbacteria bacterium CG_4_8_14_3_um_filter_36_11]PJA11044.1 MAG: tRNA 2-thiouridine(34) synthase MnmA [Candidatus Falkowbacteria bacterium CG_4_10_14_0_2_um_filter_36_22]PJB18064.1 MAG: tRNA 2-thiouridine(34) synthas
MRNKKKVVIAMSGGVDSSVAVKLLTKKNYKCLGIFLHFWQEEAGFKKKLILNPVENKCCSAKALLDARRVCQKIGINLYTLNFRRDFKKKVVDNFLNEYKSGRTPNPCVRCNKFVKLGLLIKKARKLGYDRVASGHYARLKKIGHEYKLYRAKDKAKDQSYFLYNLDQSQLKHLLFPLGEYKKEDIRKIARKYKLAVAEKKDSQEICFIPGKNHNNFLKRHLKLKSGLIKTMDDKTVGRHHGLPLYTIGQRRGVEIGGIGPFYVLKCDYKTNTLYVADDNHDPLLYSDKLIAKNVNWISGKEPKLPLACAAVIRYRHKPTKCIISPFDKGGKEGFILKRKLDEVNYYNKYLVKFSKPQRAITPGQSVVFYRRDEVLGGGIIN